MRFWRRYIWPRGRAPRRRGRGEGILLSAVLGIGLAVLVITIFDRNLRPLVTEMAKTGAENAVTAIINRAVDETLASEAVSYDDMVTLQKDASGQVTALTSNAVEMNRLRARILDKVVSKVSILDSKTLGIPLGNLTGIAALADQGPRVPVKVLSTASADGAFRNQFTSAGINQSYHRIVLEVTVRVKLLIPGGTALTEIKAQVSVAETVIVGRVPDAYLQLGEQAK